MSTNLTAEGYKELDGILFEGYKGWNDNIAERITLNHLERLAALGQYYREVVLAYVRREKSEASMKSLIKILDQFERAQKSVLHSPESRSEAEDTPW